MLTPRQAALRSSPSALLAVVIGLAVGSPTAHGGEITGSVRELGTQAPIAGALVTLQATDVQTITALDGSYVLDVPDGTGYVVVAARKGYFNAPIVVDSPSSGADMLLEPVPQDDNPQYAFVEPGFCGGCHPNQRDEWEGSAMAMAGLNTWVHDIYSGTGTPGGMGGFVYTLDSVHAAANSASECAACHQPEEWIRNGFAGPLDDELLTPPPTSLHGISCDVCHKIADIDPALTNYPGIHPTAVTYTRPQGEFPDQVMYGALGDVSFNLPELMRASYQPQLRAEVCAACHQDKNDPDGDGLFEEANGVISEPTYLEWLASPYSDEQSPLYADCVDCHMPPSGEELVCNLFPQILRDPETIRSHRIEGTTPQYLENAVDLELRVRATRRTVKVDVHVTNSHTGHHVPTGVTIRNMILLVEAWREGDDPLVSPLSHLGTQTVHELGGVGDPAAGYYAGLPGKYYSKVNHDGEGNGPTFFTDATGIEFDNRIPAGVRDSTRYTFLSPQSGGAVQVRARLIYRRSFRFLVDAKGWTEDGHGNPLADIAPPHFGHLMEIEQKTVEVPPAPWFVRPEVSAASNSTGGQPATSVTPQGTLPPVLFPSGDTLVLERAPAHAPVMFAVRDALSHGAGAWLGTLDGYQTDGRGTLIVPELPESGIPLFVQAVVWTETGEVLSNSVEIRPQELPTGAP